MILQLLQFLNHCKDAFDRLNQYNDIRIENNNIFNLPPELGYSSLNELRINWNPLVTPPKEVCYRGTQAILQYLKDLGQGQAFNSAKIIVVGDSMVGKTSLLKSLANRKPTLQDQIDRIVGLEFIQWYPPAENTALSLEFLDFAGQDSYVEVLSLHLTQRRQSAYMLLVSAAETYRKSSKWKKRTYRWMAIALSRDSSTRFTVVMSRVDEILESQIKTCLNELKTVLADFSSSWESFMHMAVSGLDDFEKAPWIKEACRLK